MVGREIISNAISCLHFLHQKLKALSFRTQTRRNIDLRRVVMFYRPERGGKFGVAASIISLEDFW